MCESSVTSEAYDLLDDFVFRFNTILYNEAERIANDEGREIINKEDVLKAITIFEEKLK